MYRLEWAVLRKEKKEGKWKTIRIHIDQFGLIAKTEKEAMAEAKSWIAEMNSNLGPSKECKLLSIFKVELVYLENRNRGIYIDHLRQINEETKTRHKELKEMMKTKKGRLR